MAFYTNQSPHSAILTIQIQSTNNPQGSIEKGSKTTFSKITADVGYHDLLVEPGQELKLGDNTTATLISVRAGD